MQVLTWLLVIVAAIAAGIGAMSLSQATAGVGGVAFACFLGILARLAQAAYHHDETRRIMLRIRDQGQVAGRVEAGRADAKQ